jgi:hypothetical protein
MKEVTMSRSDARSARVVPGVRMTAMVVALVAAAPLAMAQGSLSASGTQPTGTWGGPIDAEALQVLKAMTDYLGGLEQFSMHTENTYDDVLDTGQKIQFGFATEIVVQRPNRIRASRSDGMAEQLYIYDGSSLTIYDPQMELYASLGVPDSIDDFLHYARDRLDLVPPAGDMVFSNAFELLTAGITSGFVVGEALVDGVPCIQLAFTTPVVDWQVWIAADADRPLPYKYVLTTRDDPAQPQFETVISDWNTTPAIDDGTFEFEPSADAQKIDFLHASVAR